MRPLHLVIQGFGTYLEKQDLDFTVLEDKNIFVITGETGAGKTTIFDAIHYALYGDASGREREGISFRSDFATSSEPTFVAFWFELKGEEYYIRREPAYMEKKKRGEGDKQHKAYAEFKLPDGKTICGIKEVSQKIESLLGINKEQFKQIVMIPQGEFKKLLTAGSSEREEIFRKIFGTQLLNKVQVKMNELAKELQSQVSLKRMNRETRLKNFDCKEEDSVLEDLIQSPYQNILEIIEKAEAVVNKQQDTKQQLQKDLQDRENKLILVQQAIIKGEQINNKLEEYDQYQKQFIQFSNEISYYKEQEAIVEKAKKAETIKELEERWRTIYSRLKFYTQAAKEIQENCTLLEKEKLKIKESFEYEKTKQGQKKELQTDLLYLKQLEDKAKQYDSIVASFDGYTKQVEKLQKELELRKNLLLTKEKDWNEKLALLDRLTQIEKQALKLSNQLNEVKQDDKKIVELLEYIEEVKRKRQIHQQEEKDFKGLEQIFLKDKQYYEKMEEMFQKEQAGILAQTLQENIPCPVCGSTEHPAPALLVDKTITQEAVEKAKQACEISREKKDAKLEYLKTIYAEILTLENNRIYPEAKEQLNTAQISSLDEIQVKLYNKQKEKEETIKDFSKELQYLESQLIQIKQLQKEKKVLEKEIETGKEKILTIQNHLMETEKALATFHEKKEAIEQAFDQKVMTYQEVASKLLEKQKLLDALEEAYTKAEQAYNRKEKEWATEQGKLSTTIQTIENSKQEEQEALAVFKEKTIILGFENGEAYRAACKSEEEIKQMQMKVQQFYTQLETTKLLYEKTKKEVEGLRKVSLEHLLVEKKHLLEEKQGLLEAQNKCFAKVTSNTKILEDVKQITKQIEKQEQKYQRIGEIAKIAKGDNPHRMSFERYVLAAYFNDIVEASNVHFYEMTNHRFELLRKTQKGDARIQQGLDLEVYDHYTGKARAIETLSGGESFKASLAMALGLAEVVQSYAGGIQLDTMFVDEGFGTLDPDSLEKAIACLMRLRESGRLVGIISHVPELRERIATRLEVKRIERGSRVKFYLG